MKIVFILSLAGVFYTYVGYPLVMWALARLRTQQRAIETISPTVSIVLAVHNGVDRLPGKIQHLLDLDYSAIKEIIIVSDGSTDGTAELLLNQRSRRIKSIILPEHGGKAVAVNAGVALATGDILLFVDIRPEIGAGAIQQLVNNFADPKVGCVAGELVLKQDGHDGASEAVGGLYWRYEQWIRKCEAAFDSPVGVYGGFYAIRRNLYTPLPAGIILDDMFQPLSIIRQGYRSVLESSAIVYDIWPKKMEGEFHRKVRTLAGNFQLIRISPWTLTPSNRTLFQLFSHKLMRLAVPYLLLAMLVSSAFLASGSALFTVFTALQVLAWVLALVGSWYRIPVLHRVVSPMGALLVLNAAAVVGLYRFLFTRGPLWKIWNSGKRTEVSPMTSLRKVGLGPVVSAVEINDGSLIQK